MPGANITLQGAPSVNVESHPISVGGTSTPGVTDTSGVAEFEALDSHAETVTFTATDTTAVPIWSWPRRSPSRSWPDLLTRLHKAPRSTVAPANPPADGSTPSAVTVTLTDHFSNPVSGKTIGLTALNGKSVITPVNDVTNRRDRPRSP